MTPENALGYVREGLWTLSVVASPVLILALSVGLLMAVLQAATQIHDPSLSLIPKILAVGAAMFAVGGWMLSRLVDFTVRLFDAAGSVALR